MCKNQKVKQALQLFLEKEGIQTRNYFAGNILLHPAYKHLGKASDYPNAYDVLKRVFFLGTSPTLSDSNLSFIKERLNYFLNATPVGADGYSWSFLP